MDPMLDWGIEVIRWFQQFSPALDLPFKIFTFMGNEEFFLILLPLIYWCLDRRNGIRLIILFLFSAYLNSAVKVLAGQPRPFVYAPERIQQLSDATGNGFPSGHTQGAVVVWGFLSSRFRRTWLWVLAALMMVLVPLSRVYLGVHFPTDLLGGYGIGLVLLLLFLWLEPRAGGWLAERGLAWQLGLALAVPALMVLIFPDQDGISSSAALLGMAVGSVCERRWVHFNSSGSWWKRALRFLLGGAIVAGLYLGLRAVLSGLEPELFLRFVRYGLVGLWGGLGAPWVFVRVGLAEREMS